MNNKNVIEINNISKKFSKNIKSSKQQLKKMFFDTLLSRKNKNILAKDEFYALNDVSFVVKKDEKLAILGPNGSGKSTLLKMLNGIYMPDNGSIKIKGTVSSILELSTGFNKELSGFDNIYLKFALQGIQKEDVDEIIEEVIEFSELREFMDTPLKNYSSGMKSKLGFAIVSYMDPDILILDEVFAAGDKKFREKSEKRIKELYQNTTTILVTHSMSIVKEVADRVIVLNKGKVVFDGNPNLGIAFYNKMMQPKQDINLQISDNKYTVVTPVYNVEKYLDEYFESIVEQTLNFKNSIYLILVDDGSTDSSAEIILKWKNKFPNNITYIKKKSAGVASARNLGLEYVKTAWVTFIDAKDMICNVYFEELDKSIQRSDSIDIVSCNYMYYIDETSELTKPYLSYRFTKSKVVNPINMQQTIQVTVNSVFFKNNLLKKYNMSFNEKIVPVYEDAFFVNNLLIEDNNINILFLKEAKYFRRKKTSNSLLDNDNWKDSRRYNDALKYGLLRLIENAQNKYKETPIYLQRFVLCQIQFYFMRIIDKQDNLEFLNTKQIEIFKNLLKKLFEYIEPETIESCSLGGLWHKYRLGYYNLYKNQVIYNQVCYINNYNKISKELKVSYYFHKKDKEVFVYNGKDLSPIKEEIVNHNFLGEKFINEKILYFSCPNEWKYFNAELNTLETQMSFKNKRYKNGIQLREIITEEDV